MKTLQLNITDETFTFLSQTQVISVVFNLMNSAGGGLTLTLPVTQTQLNEEAESPSFTLQ